MANVPQTGTLNSEVIRNVGGALPWLARLPKRPELPEPGWFTPTNLTATSSHELRHAIEGLARSLRERHDAVWTVASRMMDKLQAEIESTERGAIMDPEGTGVQALEETEEYFPHRMRGVVRHPGRSRALGRCGGARSRRLPGLGALEGLVCRYRVVVSASSLAVDDQRWRTRSNYRAHIHQWRGFDFLTGRRMNS